jgi:hypothetical protein
MGVGTDYALVGSALGLSSAPAALTTGEGSLLVVNPAYRDRFGVVQPNELGSDSNGRDALALARGFHRGSR